MKAIRIQSPAGLDNLELVDTDTPSPGPNDILVRAAASSLNFHDYLVVSGATPVPDGRIPMSDVSGEVTAVGDAVTAFAVGDRVMGTFFPRWVASPVSRSAGRTSRATQPKAMPPSMSAARRPRSPPSPSATPSRKRPPCRAPD